MLEGLSVNALNAPARIVAHWSHATDKLAVEWLLPSPMYGTAGELITQRTHTRRPSAACNSHDFFVSSSPNSISSVDCSGNRRVPVGQARCHLRNEKRQPRHASWPSDLVRMHARETRPFT